MYDFKPEIIIQIMKMTSKWKDLHYEGDLKIKDDFILNTESGVSLGFDIPGPHCVQPCSEDYGGAVTSIAIILHLPGGISFCRAMNFKQTQHCWTQYKSNLRGKIKTNSCDLDMIEIWSSGSAFQLHKITCPYFDNNCNFQ